MGQFSDVLRMKKQPEPMEGEHVDENGVIVCDVCGEPKYATESGNWTHPRMCRCMREQYQAEKDAYDVREKADRIKKAKNTCFLSKEMHNMTFENDKNAGQKWSIAARKYVENFRDFKADGKGLLFYGHVGTGKTYTAACIANALIENGYKVKFTSLSRLINAIMATFEGKQAIIDGLADYDLVIIDDLGTERSTATVADYVYQIVDWLYQSNVPVIYTTNMGTDKLLNPETFEQQRIYSRILEKCVAIEINGEDMRRTNNNASIAHYKGLLGL